MSKIVEKVGSGKVRDLYKIHAPNGQELFAFITRDTITAFEQNYGQVKYKGEILNRISNYYFDLIRKRYGAEKVWAFDTGNELPGNITIGRYLEPFKIELIVRGYIAGSIARDLKNGVDLPWEDLRQLKNDDADLSEYAKLPYPIMTPTYKNDALNDPPISEKEAVEQGFFKSAAELADVKYFVIDLFESGNEWAAQKGLIIPDTKFEFGRYLEYNPIIDEIVEKVAVADECLTPNASRTWELNHNLWENGVPKDYSKEFVRQDIIELMLEQGLISDKNDSKQIKAAAPFVIIPSDRSDIWSVAYIRFFDRITGEPFVPRGSLFGEEGEKALEEYVLRNFS